jgi:hypothetical protein
MPGKLNLFNFLGVDLVRSPLHIPDGAFTQLQNAEFPTDQGEGGLKKRGAMLRLNSSALAGSVMAFGNIPIDSPALGQGLVPAILVFRTVSGVPSWLASTDGTTFSVVSAMTCPITIGSATADGVLVAASLAHKLWIILDDDLCGGLGEALSSWNGSAQAIVVSPIDPLGVTVPASPRVIATQGLLYFFVGARVYQFSPSTGQMTQVGPSLGTDTAYEVAWAFGRLWVMTQTAAGGTAFYSIVPGQETAWTADTGGNLASPRAPLGLITYNGKLYASTYTTDFTAAAIIRERDSAGTWSNSDTGATARSKYPKLIEFDDKLYAGYYAVDGGGAVNALTVRSFNGTSWSQDKDIFTDYSGVTLIGQPAVWSSHLYWPFAGATNNVVAKRTTAGVWTTPVTAGAGTTYEVAGGLS